MGHRVSSIGLALIVLLTAGCHAMKQKEQSDMDHHDVGYTMLLRGDEQWTPPPPVPQPTALPPDFPLKLESVQVDPVFGKLLYMEPKGWMGSDVAHSIPLSDTRILWLFGDTFYGEFRDGVRIARPNMTMIHNTVGIQDISGGLPGEVTYYQGGSYECPECFFPHSLIRREDRYYDDGFFWPTSGFLYRDELYVFAYDLRWGKDIAFEMIGSMLRIDNPHDAPDQWHVVEAVEIEVDRNTGHMFHTAFVIEEPYIYCLGYSGRDTTVSGQRETVLARIKGDDLVQGGINGKMEFWANGNDGPFWSDKDENLIGLYVPGNTEGGVQYVEDWGMYIAVTYANHRLLITTAHELTGPWTKPAPIYVTPQHWQVPFKTISYAMRPHPQFSTKPGEFILSYQTNATEGVAPLFGTKEGAEIYWPRFLRVQLSKKLRQTLESLLSFGCSSGITAWTNSTHRPETRQNWD